MVLSPPTVLRERLYSFHPLVGRDLAILWSETVRHKTRDVSVYRSVETLSISLRPGDEHGSARDLTTVAQLAAQLTRVHRFAVMVSPREADPEDLAQQAMLKALEHSDRYDARRGTLEAWLWRIVVNVARDAGRASRRRAFMLDRVVARSADASAAATAEEIALERLRDAALVAAVRRLPRRYRTVIALRYGASLSSQDIAELLGTTRMAVAKATRRALDLLKRDLITSGEDIK